MAQYSQTQEEKAGDITLLKSYTALSTLIGSIVSSLHHANQANYTDVIARTKRHMVSINNPRFLLKLIECLFALLFLKTSDVVSQEDSSKPQFILTRPMVDGILTLIKELLYSNTVWETASFHQQLAKLRDLTKEFEWRLTVIEKLELVVIRSDGVCRYGSD